MKNIVIIDKAPSKNDYSKYFDFEFEHFHMSSVPITKLLKKDVDLDIKLDGYDLVILVGAEAAKEYAKITSVTAHAGVLKDGKFICISNPAMLIFKPEGKPDFERAVAKIKGYVSGIIKDAAATGDFKGICHPGKAKEFLLEVLHSNAPIIALDTETTCLYPRDGHVLGLSISYKAKHGKYILTDCLEQEHIDILQEILNTYEIVFHNMKFDYKMIAYHLGLKFRRKHLHDTMLMHYVLDENEGHGLKPLALKYTDYGDYDVELDDFKKSYCLAHGITKDEFTYDLIPYDIISKYAAIDTAVTLELYNKFSPIVLNNPKLKWVYENLLVRGTLFLMDMEEVGIPMHKGRLQAAGNYLSKWILEAKEEIYAFEEVRKFEVDTGIIFNPNSVKQLRKVLFDYCKLTPTGKLTKTGALSTDVEVLTELGEQHELPTKILRVRQLSKIQNTYVNKILPQLDRDERIRTNFNLIFTTSGRLSSSGKFNAQQIPRDNPIIKGCIYAPPGYKVVSQDLTTAEMYGAAILSGDKELQYVFSSGGDFHSTIAKMVFNLDCSVEDVKKLYPDMRQSAKAISFGILYGSGAKKVSETVTKATGQYYSLTQAQEDITAYFTRFSKLKRWLKERETFIRTNGYTYSFFGRKRRLANVFSADKGIAAHEVRSGINAEIQSWASDVNLLGAMDAADEIAERGLDAQICALVHDSVVAIVKDEDVDAYCELLKRNMQKDRKCSIVGAPIGVDQEIAQDYSFGKFDSYYRHEGDILVKLKKGEHASLAPIVQEVEEDEEVE